MPARFSYIRAGRSWTNPREDFSKEGRGEKPETSSGSPSHLQVQRGQGLVARRGPPRALSLGYAMARVAPGLLVLPSPQGRGKGAREPRHASRPREAPLFGHCSRSTAHAGTVLIHTGWGKLDKPSGGFFKGGEGGKAQDQLGLPPDFQGEGADLPSDEARDGSPSRPSTHTRWWESALVPPFLPCTQGRGKPAQDLPGLQILRRISLFSLSPWDSSHT